MADTVATVEYQSLQLAATLSAAADSLRNCANVAEAFANILRQTTAAGAVSSSIQGASNFATPAAKAGKRKAGATEDGTEESGKRKRKRQPKDPNAPKRPASSYILFQNEVRKSMKETHPNVTNTELVALISKQWQEMSDQDKAIYNQAMATAKERYSADKKAYESRTPEEVAAANAAAAAALEAKKASRGNRSKQATAASIVVVPQNAAPAPAAATSSASSDSSDETTSGDDSDSEQEAHHDEEGDEEEDSEEEVQTPKRRKLQIAQKTPKGKKQKKTKA